MRVLITGATGMVGKGVLLEALDHPMVTNVVALNRSKLNHEHPKLTQIFLEDFTKMSGLGELLEPVDACFHCMGISSVGKSESEFHLATFEITKNLADIVYKNNPEACFCYVSGQGTDSTENGKTMWARVKGKTENYILNLGFGKAIMFRPGAIIPVKGVRSKTRLYNFVYVVLRPFFPLMKKMQSVSTSEQVGQAMLYACIQNEKQAILENPEIRQWAQQLSMT